MKKDQNLPNKNIHSNNSSGKQLTNNSNYSRNQLSYRGRSAEQRNSRNFLQNRYSRSNSQHNQYRNNYSRSNVIRREFSSATSSHSNPRIRHYSIDHKIHRTIEIETNQIIEIEAIQIIEINIIQITDQETTPTIEIIKDPIIYQNRSQNSSQNRNSSYNNKQRNYSQSPHRNSNRYPDFQHRYRSNTPTHQRQINQVQTTEGTTSGPPGFDDIEITELQINHINCETLDSESDTDNNISVNMIIVENDYEPIINEQPFKSHIYETQLELLHDYYTRPTSNNVPATQEQMKLTL